MFCQFNPLKPTISKKVTMLYKSTAIFNIPTGENTPTSKSASIPKLLVAAVCSQQLFSVSNRFLHPADLF